MNRMVLSKIQCVAFDLDDTLFLERDYVISGFRAASNFLHDEIGLDGFFDCALALFNRGSRGTIFNETLLALGRQDDQDLVNRIVEVYRTHDPKIQLLADARSCLSAVTSRLFCAVVTDGPLPSQRAKARVLGVDRWSSLTVYTACLPEGHQKPAIDAFRLVERSSGFSGAECLYVADNPKKDFAGPKALGWYTLRVRRDGSLTQHFLSGSDVDVEVSALPEQIVSLLTLNC